VSQGFVILQILHMYMYYTFIGLCAVLFLWQIFWDILVKEYKTDGWAGKGKGVGRLKLCNFN
jgi:hypothetical protein